MAESFFIPAGGASWRRFNMTKFSVWLHDRNGDRQRALYRENTSVRWEYNRRGGCGQGEIDLGTISDTLADEIRPQSSAKIYVNDELRYHGKIIRLQRNVTAASETLKLVTFGYMIDLDNVIVRKTYEGAAIETIIKDILDTYVVPNTQITYNAADIQETDYSLQSLSLNHSAKDAIVFLAGLAGEFEWGVDKDRKFYFKRPDDNIRRVYVIGREVSSYSEERKDDGVKNLLNVFGAEGFITQLSAIGSTGLFGTREANLFESSISAQSDAIRLAAVALKNASRNRFAGRANLIKTDEFIEATTPLGATAITLPRLNLRKKYGTSYKYGKGRKYGYLKRDQISNVIYQVINGGLAIALTLNDDVPNAGDIQKQIDYELKELQRR